MILSTHASQAEQLLKDDPEYRLLYTPPSVTKMGASYDVLLSDAQVIGWLVKAGLRPTTFFTALKFSKRRLYEELLALIPESKVVKETLLDKALKDQGRPKKYGKQGKIKRVVPIPSVKRYIMNTDRITAFDRCERCEKRAIHFRGRTPTGLAQHHLEGIEVSDTIWTTTRLCVICHSAITEKADGWEEINNKQKGKVLLAEHPEIKLLILEELQALRK